MSSNPLSRNVVALDREQPAQLKFATSNRLAFSAGLVTVPVMLADGRPTTRQGPPVVDPARLQALPGEPMQAWFGNGDLARVHAQRLSPGHLPELPRRQPAPIEHTTH